MHLLFFFCYLILKKKYTFLILAGTTMRFKAHFINFCYFRILIPEQLIGLPWFWAFCVCAGCGWRGVVRAPAALGCPDCARSFEPCVEGCSAAEPSWARGRCGYLWGPRARVAPGPTAAAGCTAWPCTLVHVPFGRTYGRPDTIHACCAPTLRRCAALQLNWLPNPTERTDGWLRSCLADCELRGDGGAPAVKFNVPHVGRPRITLQPALPTRIWLRIALFQIFCTKIVPKS